MSVGGRVNAAAFRAAVEGLLSEGRLFEAWLDPGNRRAPPHVMILPGWESELSYPVARARGHPAALAGAWWVEGIPRPDR